jgi:hypothetical protein
MPEIGVIGNDALKMADLLNRLPIPQKVIAASEAESDLPLLLNKTGKNGMATIYVCYDKTCRKPVNTIREALEEINQSNN